MAAQLTATNASSRRAAVPVDGARHQLLARSAVAQEEHRRVGLRHRPDLLEHPLHGLRAAQDVVEAVPPLDFGAKPAVLLAELLVLHRALDDQRELRKLERLGQVVVGAQTHGVDGALEAPERGHEDDPRPGLDALGLPQHGQAVHRLHDEVGENDRVLLAAERDLGVLAPRHGRHGPAVALEVTTEERHHVGIVVHDEDPGFHACSFLAADVVVGAASGSQTVKVVPSPGVLATWMSLPLDRTRSSTDRQTEARPVPSGLRAEEGVEDPRQDVRGDSGPGVPHRDRDARSIVLVRPARRRHVDPSTRRCRFDGVREEVDHHLLEMPRVDEHRRQVPRHRDSQGDAAAPGEVLQQRPEPVDDRTRIGRGSLRLTLAEGIQGGANHPRDPVDLRDDDVEILAQRGVLRQGPQGQLSAASDDVERRPDLVGDARAELAGDGERLGLSQATHQLERPTCLGLHPLVRVLQPLGHPVERRRHLPQLVTAPDGHGRPRLPRHDPLDALGQVGERAEHEPLEREPDDEGQQTGQDEPTQQALRVLPEEIGLQATRDVGDLEHPVVGARWPDRQEHGVDPDVRAPVGHDRRLAGVPNLPVPVQGEPRVAGQEVRVEACREVRVQQADTDDLGLLHDQVGGEPLDVGERVGSKPVLHGEPDRRARDADALIELRPPLLALLLPAYVCVPRHDENHRDQEKQHQAES